MRKWSLLALTALVCATAVGAAMYKWIDEQGVTHYSEAPPANQKAQRLDIQTAPASPTTATTPPSQTKSWREKSNEFDQRHRARQEQMDEEFGERQRAAELADIKRGLHTPVPGGTGVTPQLQRGVLEVLVTMDSSEDPPCANHKVIDTKWIESNRRTRTTVERWTMDRCGMIIQYRVTIMPGPQGGLVINAQRE